MSIKEELNLALEELNETELRQVAEYIAFLKFRHRWQITLLTDSEKLKALYAESPNPQPLKDRIFLAL